MTAFTRKSFPFFKTNVTGDALDTVQLRKVLVEGGYDVVINAIGVLNSDADENPSRAVFLNSYLPHFIADVLKETPARLIHMSTDCVFAGNTGPYTEQSQPDGKSFYDRTKAIGEVVDNRNLTFRNSIVGPDIDPQGIGLFNWFMKQPDGELNGYTGAIWTGVTTLTLAKAMERAIEENLTGLYNLVNNRSISKFDLLGLFNKDFRGGKMKIVPSDSLKLDKTLLCTRQSEFSFQVPSYETMVAEMREWGDNHKDIYPHYF